MNGLDYALLIVVGFGVLYGLAHGALRMATSILSFVLGLYLASLWHKQAAALAGNYLHTSPTASDYIGYIAVFVIVFVAVEIVGQRIIALAHIVNLNFVDRLGGALFGAALAAVFAGLDVVILTAILPANYPLLQQSQLAPRLLSYNEMLLEYVPPQVKELYEEKRSQFAGYWNGKNNDPAAARDRAR
ncbi:MAG TPA: CvpA family protein [Candidatus Binataceae bacterium]|nr:CvpA family protein [Candidatus Binataceae bacterium]